MRTSVAGKQAGSMGFFALHLLLALLWSALMGWTFFQFGVGMLIGLIVLLISARAVGSVMYLRALGGTARLFGQFLLELVRANLHLARDILRHRQRFSPAILAFDVSALGCLNTSLLVSLVSLTPGSLCIDLDPTEDVLFVHTLYAHEERKAREHVQHYVEALRQISGREIPPVEGV